jgi:hypothetical protein
MTSPRRRRPVEDNRPQDNERENNPSPSDTSGIPRTAILTVLGLFVAAIILIFGSQVVALRTAQERASVLEKAIFLAKENNNILERQRDEANSEDWAVQRLLGLSFQRKGDWEYVPLPQPVGPPGRQVFIPERQQARLPKWQQWLNWFTGDKADPSRQRASEN